MTTKKHTPANTKAAKDAPEGEHTKLADVENPAELTDAKIQEISGDDGTDEAENGANKDAAEAMKQDRDEAKGRDDPEGEGRYFAGQGGAQGI